MNDIERFLTDCISYCPCTGLIKWKKDIPHRYYKSNRSKGCFKKSLGSVAGYRKVRDKQCTDYIEVKSLGFRFLAHRAAWFLMMGNWPEIVDHVDHNGMNNKWSNLRASNKRENARNMKLSSSNTSGFTGVFFEKRRGKWRSEIMVDGKNIFLGLYTDKADAIASRMNANSANLFHRNHGINL